MDVASCQDSFAMLEPEFWVEVNLLQVLRSSASPNLSITSFQSEATPTHDLNIYIYFVVNKKISDINMKANFNLDGSS